MNKTLIVLLAVCLISVHAFVKRDAPETTTNDALANIEKDLKETAQKVVDFFDSDNLKNTFNDALNTVQDTIKKIQKPDAPKA